MAENLRTPLENQIAAYLSLGGKFETLPKVELELNSGPVKEGVETDGQGIAVSTAYQCYFKGETVMKSRPDEHAREIAASTLDAGHHTTRMHQHVTFRLAGVTRSITHELFHANPFYNSEQQSQRYVEAVDGSYLVPTELTAGQEAIYLEAGSFANQAYFELLGPLIDEAAGRVEEMYPDNSARVEGTAKRMNEKARKIGQEVARYVLPIGQKTTMFHTLSALQLLRLFRASQMPHISDEGRFIVASMVNEVAKYDPTILDELRVAPDYRETFDSREVLLKDADMTPPGAEVEGGSSILLNSSENHRTLLIAAARKVVGDGGNSVSDDELLDILLNPRKNRLLADVYDVGMLDPLTAVLRQIHLKFETVLSHTADSQRQRHRRTPGSTPPIAQTYTGSPDYTTPMIIKESPEMRGKFDKVITRIYGYVNELLQAGVPEEYALLLLPNAHNIRLIESGDFFDWHHRWRQRLCLLAQEEIFFISLQQAKQARNILPEAADILLAPCTIRQFAGLRPRCPEGNRWCGQPVYNWSDLESYEGKRLV